MRTIGIPGIPTWRLILTGGAIVLLLGLGIGFAAASTTRAPAANAPVAAAPTAAPGATAAPNGGGHLGLRAWLANREARFLGIARHLVHITATVTDKNGDLITIQIDHGTVASVGSGTLTITESGGSTISVSTDSDTKVWVGRTASSLGTVKVGDEVFVQSRVNGGQTLAKRLLEVPAKTGS